MQLLTSGNLHYAAADMLMTFPAPQVLETHDANAAERWKKFCLAWMNYALATELGSKPESVQVETLLTVIGEEARDVFSTFGDWAVANDKTRTHERNSLANLTTSIKRHFISWLKVASFSQSHQRKYSLIALSSGLETAR